MRFRLKKNLSPQGYETNHKVEFFFFFIIFFSPALLIPSFGISQVQSAPTQTQKKAQAEKNLLKKKKELEEIKKKLATEKSKLKKGLAQEKNQLSRLRKVDENLENLKREKRANEQDLQETRLRLNGLQHDVEENKEQLEQSKRLLTNRLRALYRMSFRTPFLGGIMASESFGDLARRLKFEMLLAKSNEKLLTQTLHHESELEADSQEWNGVEGRKKRILGALENQQKSYSRERNNRTSILATLRREQTKHEQTIQYLNEAKTERQKKVDFFLRQALDEEKKSNGVSVGQGLAVKRGKIPWPVSGNIISRFGKQLNPEFNVVVQNVGIQIRAPLGTPFRAVASGKVQEADWAKGNGKLVILYHGRGYHSIYGQADELNVKEGDWVEAGQILGTVGDSESLVGSSLYFEIRYYGTPKDPENWLKHQR